MSDLESSEVHDECYLCGKRVHKRFYRTHISSHKNAEIYVCEVEDCGKRFVYRSSFWRHMRIHAEEKPYHCEGCGKSFRDPGTVKRHRKLHADGQSYECEICGKSFLIKSELKHHITEHAVEKPYVCEICGRGFGRKIYLKAHYRTHNKKEKKTGTYGEPLEGVDPDPNLEEERPYICTLCFKRFYLAHHLKRHQLVHTKERPHTCLICNKSFALKTHLQAHNLVHVGKKTLECDKCGKKFSDKWRLKQHVIIHGEKRHTCSLCKKRFFFIAELNRHLNAHSKGEYFFCEICDARFRKRVNLSKHYYEQHGDEKLKICDDDNDSSIDKGEDKES